MAEVNNLILLNEIENFGARLNNPYADIKNLPALDSNILKHLSPRDGTVLISPYSVSHAKNIPVQEIRDLSWPMSKSSEAYDFNGYADLDKFGTKTNSKPIILLCALEWLPDIRPLLTNVRETLKTGGGEALIVSRSSKNSNFYGFRSWRSTEMLELLRAFGFRVSKLASPSGWDIYKIECDSQQYESFLERNNLPPQAVNHLMVTTEHSAYRVTGGIGSYVKECMRLYGKDSVELIIDSNKDIDLEKIEANRWLAAQLFLSRQRIETITEANYDTVADLVYEALQSICCLYPNLSSVESQEMLLYRAIEAKRVGLLPSRLKLITTCHGSSFHLAKARQDVIEPENIHVAYREKYTIEHSDTVIFPTFFLRESYRDSGLKNLDDPSRVIKRLPFDYKRLPKGENLNKYKRLVYMGKTSATKGFDLFLGSLIKLYDEYPETSQRIEEVVAIVTSTNIIDKHIQNLYRHVETLFNIRMISLNREDLLITLAGYSKDSLALLTYRGDNHTLAALELMAVGHDFLAADAGGTPELIPDEYKSNYLIEPNESIFADRVNNVVNEVGERSIIIRELSQKYREDQENINRSYTIEEITKLPVINEKAKASKIKDVYVDVIDIGDAKELKKTLASLETQNLSSIRISVRKQDEEPKRLHNSEQAAHIRVYAGDILASRALELMLGQMNSTGAGVVLPYVKVSSYLGDKFQGFVEFHPYPPELGSVFLQEKHSRRVIGLFRANLSLTQKYSDWLKCIQAASAGVKVEVFPNVLAELVDLKDYANFDELKTISEMTHAYKSLPVFDSYILYSQLKLFDEIYYGTKLYRHLEDIFIRRDDPRVLITSTEIATLVRAYDRLPRSVRRVTSLSLRLSLKILRRLKSFAKEKTN